jgi:hypothetical protein
MNGNMVGANFGAVLGIALLACLMYASIRVSRK